MSITAKDLLDASGQYILHTGIVTGKDLIVFSHTILHQPEKLQKTRFIVASFDRARAIRISEREAQVLGQQFSLIGEFLPQGAVVALVAPEDDLFALASIWEERITCECCQAAAFRDVADAEVWVCQKMREHFGLEYDNLELASFSKS